MPEQVWPFRSQTDQSLCVMIPATAFMLAHLPCGNGIWPRRQELHMERVHREGFRVSGGDLTTVKDYDMIVGVLEV